MARYAVPAVLIVWAVFIATAGAVLVPLWLVLTAGACWVQGRALWERYRDD